MSTSPPNTCCWPWRGSRARRSGFWQPTASPTTPSLRLSKTSVAVGASHRPEPRGKVPGPATLWPRSRRSSPTGQARSGHRPRRRNSPNHAGLGTPRALLKAIVRRCRPPPRKRQLPVIATPIFSTSGGRLMIRLHGAIRLRIADRARLALGISPVQRLESEGVTMTVSAQPISDRRPLAGAPPPHIAGALSLPVISPPDLSAAWPAYVADALQRGVLFLDLFVSGATRKSKSLRGRSRRC